MPFNIQKKKNLYTYNFKTVPSPSSGIVYKTSTKAFIKLLNHVLSNIIFSFCDSSKNLILIRILNNNHKIH